MSRIVLVLILLQGACGLEEGTKDNCELPSDCVEGFVCEQGRCEAVIPITRENYALHFAETACGQISECCQAEDLPSSELSCIDELTEQTTQISEKVRFDATLAKQCLSITSQWIRDECGLPIGPVEETDLEGICGRVWEGWKSPGEACGDESECTWPKEGDRDCSAPQGSDGNGICQHILRGQAGDGCGDDPIKHRCDPYQDYLFCDRTDSDRDTWTCRPLIQAGGSCTYHDYCATGYFCRLDGGTGRCSSTFGVGGVCHDSAGCDRNAYCDQGTKLCATRKASGEQCVYQSECISGTCTDEACAEDEFVFAGLCLGDEV